MLTLRNIDNHDCQLCHQSRQSIHNVSNVPLEPERAAKARRAVVASYSLKSYDQVFHFLLSKFIACDLNSLTSLDIPGYGSSGVGVRR